VGFVIGETIFEAHRHNCAPWLMGTPFRITKCQALISVCRSLYDRVFSRIATSMAALPLSVLKQMPWLGKQSSTPEAGMRLPSPR